MSKAILTPVLTENAPRPIGPYSQAMRVENPKAWIFCSGQIPLDAKTGELAAQDVVGQAHKALENLKAVVEGAGATLNQVVKTTVFLKSMGDFPKVNEVYGKFFASHAPARSTVEVARLPKDVLVEVEAIVAV